MAALAGAGRPRILVLPLLQQRGAALLLPHPARRLRSPYRHSDAPAELRCQQYHAGYAAFPHESTAEQFFSESQFESYRQLGLHVVRTTFENVDTRPSEHDQQHTLDMFQDLCRKWYPAPSFPEGKASNLTEQYSAFLRRISDDRELAFLDNQLFEEMPEETQPTVTPRKAVYFCMELVQFMEDVYFELNLQHRGDRENPVYQGWDRIFRRWAKSQAIGDAWQAEPDRAPRPVVPLVIPCICGKCSEDPE